MICSTHVLQNASLFDQWIVMRAAGGEGGERWGTVDRIDTPQNILRYYGVREAGELYARLEGMDTT